KDFVRTVFIERDTRNGFHNQAQENVPQIIINTVSSRWVQKVQRKNCFQYFVARFELSRKRFSAGKPGRMREQLRDSYSVLRCLPERSKKIASLIIQRKLISHH